MLSKRAAVWLIALAASLAPAVRAQAQPANSNLQYQSPTPVYENGSAPYSDDTPEQGHGFSPFSPVHFEPDYEMFAPAETSGYGNGPRAKIGYFGSYERVFWSISKPATATIGSQSAEGFGPGPGGVVDQFNTNTADTGFLLANGAWGNRWELGYVDDDNYGWLVSILDHVSQAQYHVFNGAQVLFNDPGQLLSGFAPFVDPVTGATIDRDINNNHIFGRFGQDIGVANPNPPPSTIFFGNPTQPAPVDTGDLVPLVPSFYWLIAKNVTQINGTEVMRMYRAPRLHSGGFFELLYGVRWLQVNDTFLVMGIGGLLDNSTWSTRAQNNMVGPQLGARFWSQRGRWITSFEAHVMAAANFQNVHQISQIATLLGQNTATLSTTPQLLPVNLANPIGWVNNAFATTFSPVGELRLNVSYQVTRAVALKVGYTGLVVGNVTRASNRVDYSQVKLISIAPGGTHQGLFVNGINVGVEINR